MPDKVHVAPFGVTSCPASWDLPAALEITPKTAYASMNGAATTGPWRPCLRFISDSGHVVAECVSEVIVAAGGSADVTWFPGAELEEEAAGPSSGVIADTFMYDTTVAAGTSSAMNLVSGAQYLVTVQGTWTAWNHALNVGSPNADAMFPGSTAGRASTQVGLDAECSFAFYDEGTGFTLGHENLLQFNVGSGFSHPEPQGGPFGTPQTNYLYRYDVTGQGVPLIVKVSDVNYSDNYGKLQVTIYNLSGASSGGGGAGSLVPPDGADYAVLQPLSGVYSWATGIDGGSA